MLRKICGGLFILVVLLSALSNPLAAQAPCAGKMAIYNYTFLNGDTNSWPKGCVWAGASVIPGDYYLECWTSSCPPPRWCPDCNGKGVPISGNPINLTNGNTYIQERDVTIPGLGGGLTLERTWNSIWPAALSAFQTGMFGSGWRSTYEERVFTGSGVYSGYMLYLQANGGTWVFTPNGSNWSLASPASSVATLTQNGTQPWTLTFQNGAQRIFNYTSGSLTSIKDTNGNTTTLTYDASNRLTTVTDPASRTLTFTYGNSSFPNQVTSLTSSVGISYSYSYDTQGRLSQVTKPDLTTVSFTYNSQSLITAVTDSQGKTLESHTYDTKNRGLTSSRAGGVDAVTIVYQ
jgi:YD repeat-containing protein